MNRIFIALILLSLITIEMYGSGPGNWRRLIDRETFDLAANPKNYNTLYAGGLGRLVYRSWDGGKTWDTLSVIYQQGTAILNNVLVHPEDTNVVLVGGLSFGEIYRSSDMGDTWEAVLTRTRPVALNGKAMMHDEKNPDLWYLGDFMTGDVFRSTNGGENWDSISTVKKKYTIKDHNGNDKDTLIYITIGSMGMRNDSTNILFANSTAGDIFMSKDSGFTWNFITKLITPDTAETDCEITRLVFSPRDPLTGYCVITYLFYGNLPNGGLYKTTDGGYNWFLQAFKDTSMWAVSVREYNGQDEVFIGGYTEDFYVLVDSMRVPGVGIVRRSLDGGQTWYSYDEKMDWWNANYRENVNFNALSFSALDTGYAVGDLGLMWKTLDGGKRWKNFTYEIMFDIQDVHFLTPEIIFITGENGEIFRSTNSGVSWREDTTNVGDPINSITMLNKDKGIAVGGNGTILRLNAPGAKWAKVSSGTSVNLNSVRNLNGNEWIAVGNNGIILKSLDDGASWLIKESGTDNDLIDANFIDGGIGIAVGENGTIIKTTNSGESWTQLNSETALKLNAIDVINSEKAIAVGDSGVVLRSNDGGNSWLGAFLPYSKTLTDVELIDEQIGCITAHNRFTFSTSDGGNSWNIGLYGKGPTANMWSLRYFGDPGSELLYMATEAGLFVLEDPSSVWDYGNQVPDGYFRLRTKDESISVYFDNKKDCNGYLDITIYDIMGNMLQRYRTSSEIARTGYEINTSKLSKGVYFIQLYDEISYYTGKVIKD